MVHLGATPVFIHHTEVGDQSSILVVKGILSNIHKGNTIELFPVGANPEMQSGICYADVENVKVTTLNKIKDSDHLLNQDPSCRDYTGLLKKLTEIDSDFDINEMVTVIYFKKLVRQ